MAFELTHGDLRQCFCELDSDLPSALEERRSSWDIELRSRDDNASYGIFSALWGLDEPGPFASLSENSIASTTPSQDPCKCKYLAGICSVALNRLQEAYLLAQTEPLPLRVAAPRAFWLWLTRHTDHRSGILAFTVGPTVTLQILAHRRLACNWPHRQ